MESIPFLVGTKLHKLQHNFINLFIPFVFDLLTHLSSLLPDAFSVIVNHHMPNHYCNYVLLQNSELVAHYLDSDANVFHLPSIEWLIKVHWHNNYWIPKFHTFHHRTLSTMADKTTNSFVTQYFSLSPPLVPSPPPFQKILMAKPLQVLFFLPWETSQPI